MTQQERRDRFVDEQEQVGRDLASGKYKGDPYKDGKPVPRVKSEAIFALVYKFAELDDERIAAIK